MKPSCDNRSIGDHVHGGLLCTQLAGKAREIGHFRARCEQQRVHAKRLHEEICSSRAELAQCDVAISTLRQQVDSHRTNLRNLEAEEPMWTQRAAELSAQWESMQAAQTARKQLLADVGFRAEQQAQTLLDARQSLVSHEERAAAEGEVNVRLKSVSSELTQQRSELRVLENEDESGLRRLQELESETYQSQELQEKLATLTAEVRHQTKANQNLELQHVRAKMEGAHDDATYETRSATAELKAQLAQMSYELAQQKVESAEMKQKTEKERSAESLLREEHEAEEHAFDLMQEEHTLRLEEQQVAISTVRERLVGLTGNVAPRTLPPAAYRACRQEVAGTLLNLVHRLGVEKICLQCHGQTDPCFLVIPALAAAREIRQELQALVPRVIAALGHPAVGRCNSRMHSKLDELTVRALIAELQSVAASFAIPVTMENNSDGILPVHQDCGQSPTEDCGKPRLSDCRLSTSPLKAAQAEPTTTTFAHADLQNISFGDVHSSLGMSMSSINGTLASPGGDCGCKRCVSRSQHSRSLPESEISFGLSEPSRLER